MKLKKTRKSKLLTAAKRQTPKLTEIKALNRNKDIAGQGFGDKNGLQRKGKYRKCPKMSDFDRN
jgi:hypothetical protein